MGRVWWKFPQADVVGVLMAVGSLAYGSAAVRHIRTHQILCGDSHVAPLLLVKFPQDPAGLSRLRVAALAPTPPKVKLVVCQRVRPLSLVSPQVSRLPTPAGRGRITRLLGRRQTKLQITAPTQLTDERLARVFVRASHGIPWSNGPPRSLAFVGTFLGLRSLPLSCRPFFQSSSKLHSTGLLIFPVHGRILTLDHRGQPDSCPLSARRGAGEERHPGRLAFPRPEVCGHPNHPSEKRRNNS